MNRLSWLRLYAAAVSDTAGEAELYTYGELDSTTTHLPYEGEQRDASVEPLAVRTVRLDDLVDRGELRPPNFVKVDVEGHGHRALMGMRATLKSARPILIVGFHSDLELQEVIALLRPLHYTACKIGEELEAPSVAVGADYLFTPTA